MKALEADDSDRLAINLSRLVYRLESKILSSDSESQLRTDGFERAKVAAVST